MTGKYLKKIIDGVPTAVVVINKKLKAVFSNNAFKNLFPFKKSECLGEITCCAHSASHCGGEDCKGCQLKQAFTDAHLSQKDVNRRIFQKVNNDGLNHDVCYSLTVKPLGGELYMGIIDDAFELEIAQELQTAKDIQQRLLPAGNWAGGKRYSYMYVPCRDIGGDLPDVFTVGNSACGVIADVSGKGISAGMLSAFVKAAYDKTEFSPAKAIENLNRKFAALNLDERNYVTVATVRIDADTITYSMAGHNVPILLKTGTGITRIMLNSPPVSSWFENPSYYEDVIPYKKGDILVLLTDGVTECKNARGEMFGADGAIKTLSVSRTAEEFIKNLETNLKNFKSNFDDDITAIAFDL
ncbi:MAG: serine/threonine-protein phosphatase [Clostridia bacterium]|nr:serine/threonine-protein phosphatase [Clostridia bacterium]